MVSRVTLYTSLTNDQYAPLLKNTIFTSTSAFAYSVIVVYGCGVVFLSDGCSGHLNQSESVRMCRIAHVPRASNPVGNCSSPRSGNPYTLPMWYLPSCVTGELLAEPSMVAIPVNVIVSPHW
jgi:hypothetical protein